MWAGYFIIFYSLLTGGEEVICGGGEFVVTLQNNCKRGSSWVCSNVIRVKKNNEEN